MNESRWQRYGDSNPGLMAENHLSVSLLFEMIEDKLPEVTQEIHVIRLI